MRKSITRCLSMMFVLIMCISMVLPTTVFAASTEILTVSGEDVSKMTAVFNQLEKDYPSTKEDVSCTSGYLAIMSSDGENKVNILEWDPTTRTLTFRGNNFEEADKKAKSTGLKAFVDAVDKQKISSTGRQNIADKLNEGSSQANTYLIGLLMDSTNADIFTALKWLSPILQFMRIIIGIGAIALVLLLVTSTVIDCAYIGLPMWREATSAKENNNKIFKVSNEAESAVRESETALNSGTYKNAYLLYFKRRALTYVVLAICILYLIAGELGGLIQGLLDMVSGFTA